MSVLFDTNILIDYLSGAKPARRELSKHETVAVSIITWIEVMVGAANEEEQAVLRSFLLRFRVLPLSEEVATQAVTIRRASRLRLPDAIIWATARSHDLLLVTRNTKDFKPNEPGVRIPYRLST